ncbi:hypothetical protein GCM10022198_11330 [Klugiella xanthotipulae]|uniref:Uncharacterized protein n=1 Tax=Klugiella xanthotipulae TaxID=244735 RepID=A0A543HYV3_9MICO|nr:hypothetical protein [Klugiella xanthotipulae]TQM63527.1 hypothetical protein FB466_1792 [Klugiella xanthotipulae]
MTTENAPRIREFADAVRAALGDLAPEVITELTEGLESDLTDQAADLAATPEAQQLTLDDAVAYANELRTAAGLPEAAPATDVTAERRPLRELGTWARDVRATWAASIRSTPLGNGTLDFLVALRPLWWVLRGTVIFFTLAVMAEVGLGYFNRGYWVAWAAWLVCVVVSVQWGRGHWLWRRWMRKLLVLVNVCSVLALPAVTGYATSRLIPETVSISTNGGGLWLDDRQVLNIFPYDAEGNPLDNVQLFDETGQPLSTTPGGDSTMSIGNTFYDGDMVEYGLVTYGIENGNSVWNVYPLREARLNGIGEIGSTPEKAARPFERTNSLPSANTEDPDDPAQPTESPAPTATPAPTGTPTPGSTDENPEDKG